MNSILDNNIKTQLQSHFSNIIDPVELVIALDDSNKSQELKALANDLLNLCQHFSLTEDNSLTRTPMLSIRSAKRGTELNFAGVPMGHEFTSLILALLHTGGVETKAKEIELDSIKAIDTNLNFEVYISLSCQTCPGVVQALNTMAALNKNITVTMIDGALFQDEVNERNVLAVPSVYLNGELFSQGAITLSEIINKLDSGAAEKQAELISQKGTFDMLVVGGGPAGASAAIYAARKGLKTGVIAQKFGGQVAETRGIENFISVQKTEGAKLVTQLEEHVKDYEVDIMTQQKAVKLSKDNRIEVELENGGTLSAKSVVLATGARWREINVPGEQEYLGKGVAYCPHCDGPLFKGKKVAVIGGGNSGIEAAIDLANIVEHVTVLEFADTLRADEVLIRKAHSMGNIEIFKNAQTTEIIGDGKRVTGIHYTDRVTKEQKSLELAGIFVQIGLIPNTEFLKDTLELTHFGEIEIDDKGATSMPGVFAAGDATTAPFKQIIVAMGSGATASLGAFEYLIRNDDDAQNVA